MRSLTNGSSGLPDQSGLASRFHIRLPSARNAYVFPSKTKTMSSGTPSPFRSATAGELRTAPYDVDGLTPFLVNARSPRCSGSGSVWTGQPGSSAPFARNAWMRPFESPRISSLRLSPSMSAKSGDEAPSASCRRSGKG